MPPSIIHKQLFWAATVRTSPIGFFTNFVPDYLDQWALKDPGKDKHSSLRGWEKGVYFQTDQKSLLLPVYQGQTEKAIQSSVPPHTVFI